MSEYHVRQFDGPPHTCDGKNCACATGAMDIAYGSAGDTILTADQVRKQSGVSCVPNVHSPSGGLFISDIERVCRENGVSIDFGRDKPGGPPKRWSMAEGVDHLSDDFWMHVLGDYDQMGSDSAQPSFKGDHSSGVHLRLDQPKGTVCFHDPLRSKPIDITVGRLEKYWQKPGAAIRGLAGFVKIKEALVDVYSVPGNVSAVWAKGSKVFKTPTTAKPVTVTPVTTRFLIVGQSSAANPSRYLVDGAGLGASGRMAWLEVAGATAKQEESFNAGVDAAVVAAAKAHR